MKIIPLLGQPKKRKNEIEPLFTRMEASLKAAKVDFAKSIRIAKTLAPILNDQTSNHRHLETIASRAPIEEKVIAVIMLGFPNNRTVLPVLQELLTAESQALRIAAIIAISQMRNGQNNELLSDILLDALKTERSIDIKTALRRAIFTLLAQKDSSLKSDYTKAP